MNAQRQWVPSRRAQAAQWWARFFLRYLIGGGGMVSEVVLDHWKNPTALLVFAGIAGLPDVFGYRALVKAHQEQDQPDTGESGDP